MRTSLGLRLYLAFSARADNFAKKKIKQRLAVGKEDSERLNERFGQPKTARPDGQLLWFHAASVGEALSLVELIGRLSEDEPTLNFLITTGTVTSARVLAPRLPDKALHQYVPIDTMTAVCGFLDHWKPDLAIWTESEFWPALIFETHRRQVPMLLINARMSRKSAGRWRLARGLARSLLTRFSFALAQDKNTGAALVRLGVSDALCEVTGSLKEGSAALPVVEDDRTALATQLAARPVWLAASTHNGEELIIAAAHREAARSAQGLLLIIAPRHPDRGVAVAKELKSQGFKVAVRSTGKPIERDTQIYVADTLGEMGLWFRIAPVTFLGGSLVNVGGHNPFEPAALGSAIIHGPMVENFADIFARLGAANAAIEVSDPKELASTVIEVLSPEKAAAMAYAAWETCSSGAEVTDRALAVIMEHLPASTS